jgi:hypothetical protein
MLPSFMNMTIVRKRASVKTVRGSDVFDWSNTDDITIPNCLVEPGGGSLSLDGRELGIMQGLTAILPPNADVKAGDHIVYDGNIYEIDGEPKMFSLPTGTVTNMQLNLKRWQG